MIVPVILSGGSGTRLWPQSRELYPKQFLPLAEERTMLQATVGRLAGLPEVAAPLVVCNEHHRFLVAEQLRATGPASAILLEPVGRNTAPAVAVAALQALNDNTDPILLVLAADHVIRDEEAFRSAVLTALPFAQAGQMVTFGIVPTAAETGYGYIRAERDEGAAAVFPVAQFVEKPDLETARRYVASGDYFWNSGMFMFRAVRYLEELEQFAPDLLAASRKSFGAAVRDLDFIRLGRWFWGQCI